MQIALGSVPSAILPVRSHASIRFSRACISLGPIPASCPRFWATLGDCTVSNTGEPGSLPGSLHVPSGDLLASLTAATAAGDGDENGEGEGDGSQLVRRWGGFSQGGTTTAAALRRRPCCGCGCCRLGGGEPPPRREYAKVARPDEARAAYQGIIIARAAPPSTYHCAAAAVAQHMQSHRHTRAIALFGRTMTSR